MWHAIYEAAPDFVTELPGGAEWLDEVCDLRPPGQRHLALHEGHVCVLTDRDRSAIKAAGTGILNYGWTGSPEAIQSAAGAIGALGVRLYASRSRYRR